MFFNDSLNSALVKQLDAANTRQNVISDNIANINTPNFKKSEVHFKDQLKRALEGNNSGIKTTHSRHIPSKGQISQLEPEIVEVGNTKMRAGDNNVDIDEEMVKLTKNTLLYQMTGQVLGKRKEIRNLVVSGGR